MKIVVVASPEKGAEEAFKVFEQAHSNGAKVFGLATGSTPLGLYGLIRKSDLDFSDRISINLDEYVGLAGSDPHSYKYFMEQELFNEKPFKKSYLPNGLAENSSLEEARYNKLLEQNPIDLQLLGIGNNAHIGFNEPGTSFDTQTHKVRLAEETIEANKRFFDHEEDVPHDAYSMGLKSIMDAKEIILMAFGESKAKAVVDMIEGPVTEDVPASILQKHPDVTVIVDQAAASLLS